MTYGLYLAHFTGIAGNSFGLFCIGDGVISGADIGGLLYDGHLNQHSDGSLTGTVTLDLPANVQLISGLKSEHPQRVTVPLHLAPTFADGDTITRIETAGGAVNAYFQLLRELP